MSGRDDIVKGSVSTGSNIIIDYKNDHGEQVAKSSPGRRPALSGLASTPTISSTIHCIKQSFFSSPFMHC